VELLLPGDFFGFTALTEYDSAVEAVAEGTIVASYPRRRVEMLAEADPQGNPPGDVRDACKPN
jgi:CRP-like cAMP-binding protein